MGKVLFVNRFYSPDMSATSQILTDLAEFLVQSNVEQEVHVLCSRLNYTTGKRAYSGYECINGVRVHRVWSSAFGRGYLPGRLIDYLTFYITCFLFLLLRVGKGDLVVAKTDPPLVSVLAALVCKLKRACLLNWIQDLFPEVASGEAPRGLKGLALGVLVYLRNLSLRQAERNVVLGKEMARRLEQIGVPAGKQVIIGNWSIVKGVSEIPKANNTLANAWRLQKRFVLGYSGNLGRAHDYESFYRLAQALKPYPQFALLMIGAGYGMTELEKLVGLDDPGNILFKPYQKVEDLNESLQVADLHMVSLAPSMEGLIVPSKFYGILAVSKPVLFFGSSYGELGQVIEQHGIGHVHEGDNWASTINFVLSLEKSDSNYQGLVDKVRRCHQQAFGPEVSKNRWLVLINGSRDLQSPYAANGMGDSV